MLRYLAWLALPAPAYAALSASPMDYLWTHGPAADPVTRLGWGLIVISVTVIAIIAFLILLACFRKRPEPAASSAGDPPGRLPVLPDRAGIAWVYIGVGIATAVLFGSTLWTLTALAAVASPDKSAMTVEITAHQWWWEIRYRDPGPAREDAAVMVTANEIHIPVGEKVRFKLISDDVIHSFWVPKLSGKTDMIPGQVNYNWVQADTPGEYRGQCAEFCGPQHAHMAFSVIAEERTQFDAWRRRQSQNSMPRNDAASGQLAQGQEIFRAQCAVCHTVRGTSAAGRLGPDLTHLMSRRTIAAGMLPNTAGSLYGWVADAQSIKPGVHMPGFYLSPQELHAVVDYLSTLQ